MNRLNFSDQWPPPPQNHEHRMAYQWAREIPRRQYPHVPLPAFVRIGSVIFLAALIGIVTLCMLAGCSALIPSASQTPAQQLAVLSNDYNLSLVAVNVGLKTGVLTKAEVTAAQPYLDAVDAALVQAQADAAANTPALQADLNAINAALPKLAPLFLKASTATKPPKPAATKPA